MKSKALLVISNGHGEDEVAVRILIALKQLQPALNIQALSLVGVGHAYQHQGIPLLVKGQALPSGGFLGRSLGRDLQRGLWHLMQRQITAVAQWSQSEGVIMAVGDIVPLLFATWSGCPFAFVGTAKSEYWRTNHGRLSLRQSIYWPWERGLMAQARCRGVFPRDQITATHLQRWPIPVFDCGNPMMDDLEPTKESSLDSLPPGLKILLLPGSHVPEVFANWQVMVRAIATLLQNPQIYIFIGAISPGIELDPLQRTLVHQGWGPVTASLPTYQYGQHRLLLVPDGFREGLHYADMVVAMAGTATEQAVGLGKPVITLPGKGPQFTPKFAATQARLLGRSIYRLTDPQALSATVSTLQAMLPDPQHWIDNGRRRMGTPGAALRIAHCLQTYLLDVAENPPCS
ncbi:lipid-A-disaccharide synthase-related protein [Acaryochloris sp. IP29b_bin.148]|uniref:lipid-A-disaccharide synthase-related protein n=1 Tax=Acaryochloris sp. IP29b_bin.148 TaxID=2969218 RepID=UPI002603EA76|nr:lipid-A-disaccharide synthase-related protein [Acaryochloris sp. IP29b_bin.148]